MRTMLWRDSLENEAVESWSFRVRFSGGSRVPPGHLNLLRAVKIVLVT